MMVNCSQQTVDQYEYCPAPLQSSQFHLLMKENFGLIIYRESFSKKCFSASSVLNIHRIEAAEKDPAAIKPLCPPSLLRCFIVEYLASQGKPFPLGSLYLGQAYASIPQNHSAFHDLAGQRYICSSLSVYLFLLHGGECFTGN